MSALALFAFALLAAAQEPSKEPISLFDGRTLDGWDGDPRFWSVEDGAIVGRSTAETPCERTTYLVWTGGTVGDFDLRFRFRIEGGNSGLQFRSIVVAPWEVEGYQADVEDGTSWTGCLYEQGGRGVVATRGLSVSYAPDGARSEERFADSDELLAQFHRGEWNEYRVVAVGERIRFELNGAVTCELVDRDARRARSEGVLAFQLHQGPPMTIRLRDLDLREPALAPPEWGFDPSGLAGAKSRPPWQGPQWIWTSSDARDGDVACFQRAFTIGADATKAELAGSCDNHVELFLDGGLVLSVDDWAHPLRADVTSALKAGSHLLAARCSNDGGPAALQLALHAEFADGSELSIATDGEWLATPGEPEGWKSAPASGGAWKPAVVLGPSGMPPWGPLPPAESTEVELHLLEGYRAERVHEVDRDAEGSWVSLCRDGGTGFFASGEDGPIFHVLPPPLDAPERGCSVERVPVEIGDAQGLLWAFDSLYVVANGRHQTNGLYRVLDSDGDGTLDEARFLKALDGGGEHGPHAVLLGPDGDSLYVLGGNHTHLPEGVPVERWDEDQLLPRFADPNGHAVGVMAPGGWVCRTDPAGEHWQLVAHGMRNAYDAAFDADGELLTYDSDMEWDVGLPWYRPTRVLHLVQGAEFGWRNGSGKWPASYPDSLPSVVDVGLGSPTGVAFGYGARFPARFERALFIADWAYGKIFAVHLEPRGASFGASFETFVSGKPLPVTDLAVGADGALYFTVGGRGTRSALWRIVYEGDPGPGAPVREDAAAPGARAQRLLLESLRAIASPEVLEIAWPPLDSNDRFLRFAARAAIESQPVEAWSERALDETRPRAVIEAMVALAHSSEPSEERCARALERLASLPLESMADDELLGSLRAFGLACIRLGPPSDASRARLADRIEGLFPSGRPEVDRELALLLAYSQDPRAVAKSIALLTRAATQEDAIHYAYCLRVQRDGWTDESRRAYLHWLDATAPALHGGASFAKYLAAIRADAVRGMDPAELEALEPQATSALPTLPALDLAGRATHRWTVAELEPRLSALARGRDFATGAAAFRAATCITCHRIAGEGESTGPDLTGAGSRFAPRDLLEAILEPSRVVSDQYRDTEVLTKDGELFVGRVEGEAVLDGEPALRLRTQPPDERVVELLRSEIAEERPHPLSRMPEGLVDALTEEELLDLMAYVLAGADGGGGAFAR